MCDATTVVKKKKNHAVSTNIHYTYRIVIKYVNRISTEKNAFDKRKKNVRMSRQTILLLKPPGTFLYFTSYVSAKGLALDRCFFFFF